MKQTKHSKKIKGVLTPKVGDLVRIKDTLKQVKYADFMLLVSPGMYKMQNKEYRIESFDEDGLAIIKGYTFAREHYDILENTVTRVKTVGKNVLTPVEEVKQPTFAMMKTPNGITMVIDRKMFNVDVSHNNYNKVLEAIKDKNYAIIESLIDNSKGLESYGSGKIKIKDGVVVFNDRKLNGCLTDTILSMYKEGLDLKPLENFLVNLELNPSSRALNELYGFLEYGKLPITEDGCFLTYKKVRKDFMDIHSGTFDNSVGKVCEMPRNLVDDNPNNTCSTGLHVCSYEYTKSFGNRDSKLVLCKVNPRDVVSIPIDYNNTKMRCCRYEVIAEVQDKSDVLKGKVVV